METGGPVSTTCGDRLWIHCGRGERALALGARLLQDRGSRLELTGTSGVFRRMWRILRFDDYTEVEFRESRA